MKWTSEEKKQVKIIFKKYLDTRKLPPLSECKEAIHSHPNIFVFRNAITLKAYVNNEIKRLNKVDKY